MPVFLFQVFFFCEVAVAVGVNPLFNFEVFIMTIDHMPFLYEVPLTAFHGTDRTVDRSCPHICKFLCAFLNHDD